VLVFDPEELKLTTAEVADLPLKRRQAGGAPAIPLSLAADQKTAPTSGAYPMTVAQFLTILASPNRPNYEKMNDFTASAKEYARLLISEESTNVIFPRRRLVTDIFGPNGVNIEQHKHLAHVRRVNTTGMPDAGVDEEGILSVIISHRTGKLFFLWFTYVKEIPGRPGHIHVEGGVNHSCEQACQFFRHVVSNTY
jgi:hypothetical protein